MTKHPTFVHLTDIHISNPEVEDEHLYSDTTTTLRAVLDNVKLIRPVPDFIVASGDLTNRGDVPSFHILKQIIAEADLGIPILYALGNHDTRPGFHQGMLGRTENLDAPYFYDAVIAGIHVIVLDTSKPKYPGGALDAAQFAWLEERIGAHPEAKKLIVMHHAPALDVTDPDIEWESLTYADTARFAEIVAGRQDIVGIVSGHMHYDRVSLWNGIPIVMGIGQHAAMDVLHLHEGLRMVEGASLAIGTIRPSGLTVSFSPLPSTRRELMKISYEQIRVVTRKFYAEDQMALAE